jgi:hypothetical protein
MDEKLRIRWFQRDHCAKMIKINPATAAVITIEELTPIGNNRYWQITHTRMDFAAFGG